MALLHFHVRSSYNGAIYEPGNTYEVEDFPKGYIQRWIKRGVAEEVEDASEVHPDPRGAAGLPPEAEKQDLAEEDFTGLEEPEEEEEEDFEEEEEDPDEDK